MTHVPTISAAITPVPVLLGIFLYLPNESWYLPRHPFPPAVAVVYRPKSPWLCAIAAA